MREIKFRAWNTKTNEMFSAEVMAEDQLTLLPTGQFINVHSASTRLSVIYPLETMIPMQYTGLKDRNGKEIYEGDIVKDKEGTGVVGYAAPMFVVQEKNVHFMLGAGNCYPNNYQLKETVVIGNIYENPELLK